MKKLILLKITLLSISITYAQGGWLEKANVTSSVRLGSFGFSIGSKVYVGGGDNNSNVFLNDFWEYDPTTNVWTQKANYSSIGRRFGVGFSIGAKGYTGLGEASATLGFAFSDFYEYNPLTNNWTQKAAFPDGGRRRAVGIGNSTMGYISTGVDFNSNQKNDIWEYNPINNTWTQKANLTNGKRTSATGFSINDMIYVSCGIDSASNMLNDLWMYNPSSNTWIQQANFPGIGRISPTGFSIANYGYIGGGTSYSPISTLSDFFKYNTLNNTWSAIPDLPIVISSGIGTSLNGRGYVGTGQTTNGRTNLFYEFDPLCGLSFTFSKINIQCNGANSGSITITAAGGTTPYQYSIDNGVNYQTSNLFVNLAPNTYYLVVTDSNSCISNTQNSTVTEPNAISFTTSQVNVKCFGGNTGSITVSASGGTGTLQYSKDNGTTWQSSSIFSNLIVGAYDIKVKNANNCITSSQTITITQPAVLSFTTSQTNVLCNGGNSGSITISATGGITPYQYSKNNGSSYQSSNVFANLTAGNNTILVKDSNNCVTSSQLVTIIQPSSISVTINSTNLSCNGSNDGTITITSSGGISPYQYSIDGGANYQSSNMFSNLIPAIYNIIVRDANNCISSSQNRTITQPTILTFSATQSNISCSGSNNGSITVSASGGTSPFQYSSDNGQSYQSANTFSNLNANTYIVLIKDANNCITNSQSFTISEPTAISFSTNQNDVTCNGGNNGSITVSATGGSGTLQYSSNNGTSFQSSSTFTNLVVDIYNIKVKDGNNCITNSQTVNITEPIAILQPTITASGPLVFCIGDSVILTSSSNNSYNWSTSATTQSITVYNSSTITVSVSDNFGCSSSSNPISITTNSLPQIPIISASGNTLISSSTTDNQWYLNGAIINGATNHSYVATQNGNYSVEVTNSFNCSSMSEQFNYFLTVINENYSAINISVYPNPTNGLIFLDLDNVSISEINILNVLGGTVYKSNKKVSSIDLSKSPKGLYLLLLTNNGQIFTKKIIIQ